MLVIKKIFIFLNLLGLIVLFTACGTVTSQTKVKQTQKQVEKIPDTALSYRHMDLSKADNTPAVKYSDKDPGESVRLQRSFENAPPIIPHNIEDFLPITQEDNQCLGCHDPKDARDADAPQTPSSHLFDLRRNKKLNTVNNANFNCMSCHVPQSNAPILIGNNFKAEYRSDKSKKSSNLLDVINEGVKGE